MKTIQDHYTKLEVLNKDGNILYFIISLGLTRRQCYLYLKKFEKIDGFKIIKHIMYHKQNQC